MLKLAFASVAVCSLFACSSNNSGSTAQGQAAVDQGQSIGGTALAYESQSDSVGDTYEGVVCNDANEGIAWCDDDYNIVYCDAGTWYSFDCAYLGDVCAQYDDGTIDCYDNVAN